MQILLIFTSFGRSLSGDFVFIENHVFSDIDTIQDTSLPIITKKSYEMIMSRSNPSGTLEYFTTTCSWINIRLIGIIFDLLLNV